MNNKITSKEFNIKFKLLFPKLKVLGDYKNTKKKILIEDELGILYNCYPFDLLKGCQPSSKAAINRNDYFIKKSKHIHKREYNYDLVNYIHNKQKVDIVCPIHGIFKQIPKDHLNGRGCFDCSKEKGVWSKSSWKCNSLISTTFDGYKLYIIELQNKEEKFLKIGRTFRKIKIRFQKGSLPYNYKIKYLYHSNDSDFIFNIENKIKTSLKTLKYTPNQKFIGSTECFLNTSYDRIIDIIEN